MVLASLRFLYSLLLLLLLIPLIFFSVFNSPETSFATHSNQTYSIEGNDVPCFATAESNMCGFFSQPWDAVKHVLFVDYLGDWFIAIVFFPIYAVVFLLTKNATYAGLIGVTIVAGTNQAESLAFEVMIPLIAISTGLAFFEVIRKRSIE